MINDAKVMTPHAAGVERGQRFEFGENYPYEVATPEEIFDFYRSRGFSLVKMRCGGVGLGCDEFVFEKHSAAVP